MILLFWEFCIFMEDNPSGLQNQNPLGIMELSDLLLDLRRLTGVALRQQKGPSTPLEARTAPRALLAFRRQTMLDNITPLAIGAVQHLDDHRFPHSRSWFSLTPRG